LGKTRPYALILCNIGTPGCSEADSSTPEFHRVEGTFSASPFGTFTDHEVQRKRASASDDTFVTIQTDVVLDPVKNKLTFIDYTELADGVNCKSIRENDADCEYAYRVRGLSTDGNTGWSTTEVISAVDDAPVASPDSFSMFNKNTLKVAAPGVLSDVSAITGGSALVRGKDTDNDSPLEFRGRRVELVTPPTKGTLTLNPDGSFTYKPFKTSFVGTDFFEYRADDGESTNDGHSPTVPLSAWSPKVSVTINVQKK
jgi:hypothetical protein